MGERWSRKPEQASMARTAIDNEFEKKKETNISRMKTNDNSKVVVSDTKMLSVGKRNKERYIRNNEINIETKDFNNEINEIHEDPVNDSRMIDEKDSNPLQEKTVAPENGVKERELEEHCLITNCCNRNEKKNIGS